MGLKISSFSRTGLHRGALESQSWKGWWRSLSPNNWPWMLSAVGLPSSWPPTPWIPWMPENSHPRFVHFSFLSLVFHSWGQRERRFKAETSFSHMVKNPSANAGNKKRCRLDPWVRKIPWSRKWQPNSVFLPGKWHGQKSLVSYSPWGCRRVGHNWVHMHSCTAYLRGNLRKQKERSEANWKDKREKPTESSSPQGTLRHVSWK